MRKRASGKRESDEHLALVVSASLGRVSALGKTKRKKTQNFQFEYPFITTDMPHVLLRLSSQGKGKEMYCERLISFSSFVIIRRFSVSEGLQKCYPVYVGVNATKVTFSPVSSVISVNLLTFLSGWVMVLS